MSEPFHGALVVGQSGGPTPVIKASLADVANAEHLLPRAFMDEAGNMVTRAFEAYALPLIDGPFPPDPHSGLPARFRRTRRNAA